MIKRLLVIANPGAGIDDDSLTIIQDLLDDAGATYELTLVKKPTELGRIIKNVSAKNFDAVAVYGGDGTVAKAAQLLQGKNLPLLVLPGGTANALAKGLGQSGSLARSLSAAISGEYKIVKIDLAFWDKEPFVLDLHFGSFERTITKTPRKLKRHVGRFAYVLQAMRELAKSKQQPFKLEIDGVLSERQASVLMISNAGQPKILGQQIFGRTSSLDGQLDVALFKGASFWAVLGWYLQKRLFGLSARWAVEVFYAKKVKILTAPGRALCDDVPVEPQLPITIHIEKAQLPVLVPLKKPLRTRVAWTWRLLTTEWFRGLDHLRRLMTGAPYLNFSQVNDHLFVGGQPGRKGKILQKWGITAVVSMRTRIPSNLPSGMKVLHLPTPDHHPIELADLKRGIEFINKQVAGGGRVYVHCRAGEGRAASMAIAYLMSQGMWLNEALELVKKYRVFVRPNKSQLARLREFGRSLRKNKKLRA